MSKTVAIIQARMGSTRLPEKVLMDIGEKPMLWHVHERAGRASLLDEVVIATSTESADDEVAAFCADQGIQYVRGSEADVLDRYYQTAVEMDADTVVRLTADCPFLSPSVVDRVVRKYEAADCEYISNTIEYTHPDGLDVEVFDMEALETTWQEATEPREREHVTLYMRESEAFQSKNVENVLNMSAYDFVEEDMIPRWTVDYPEDIEFIRAVYERLAGDGHWVFDQQSVLELLERTPALCNINEDRFT
ncbi:glycosyltransferase family protein [Halovenus rubra]|uniref:Glycosyltransferase family protein n=2 Tax=Halovenus rubra TaxID=869890 RepID=A0ABD5XCM3_9EURY|nr:glycosyltransferase family protein [Halovenus rubra]